MKPEEQRIAILTALGWTKLRHHEEKKKKQPDGEMKVNVGPWHALWGTDPSGKEGRYAPNPVTSLDSMHEAEALIYPNFETATDDEMRTWMRYRKQLGKVAFVNCQEGAGLDERLIRATAVERAEAFCRVKYPERFEP